MMYRFGFYRGGPVLMSALSGVSKVIGIIDGRVADF
jgi:hypothetical protein